MIPLEHRDCRDLWGSGALGAPHIYDIRTRTRPGTRVQNRTMFRISTRTMVVNMCSIRTRTGTTAGIQDDSWEWDKDHGGHYNQEHVGDQDQHDEHIQTQDWH